MLINNENYEILAIQHYQGHQSAGRSEFEDDLKRLHYIKRLLKRYERTGEMPDRLVLNHFIVLFNTFGSFGNTLLWYKMPELAEFIKPFPEFLNMLPPVIHLNNREIITQNIKGDAGIESMLRGI